MSKETDAKITEYLQSIGVAYSCRYVGETVKNDDWKCDAWRVSFTRSSKPAIETDYFTGLGHRKWPKYYKIKFPKNTRGHEREERLHLKPAIPSSAGVLHSLLMDANAIDTSFECWCSDYGYSSDSISAFNTYRSCCEIGEKIRRLFGHNEMSTMRDMLCDY